MKNLIQNTESQRRNLKLFISLFMKNKVIFIQSFLLIIFSVVIINVLSFKLYSHCFFYFQSISNYINSIQISIASLDFLLNIIHLILVISFVTIPVWYLFIVFPFLIFFARVLLYRIIIREVTNLDNNKSFSGIFSEELSNIKKLITLSKEIFSLHLKANLKIRRMKIQFVRNPAKFSLIKYVNVDNFMRITTYSVLDYAVYHNSAKDAVLKSYIIVKNRQPKNIHSLALFFFLMLFSVFCCVIFFAIILSFSNSTIVLANYNLFLTFLYVSICIIFFAIISIIFYFSSFVNAIDYLRFNNEFIANKNKQDYDFQNPDKFFEGTNEIFNKRYKNEPIKMDLKYIPIKEEYKKMIELS